MLDYKKMLDMEVDADIKTMDPLELSELIFATERDIVDITLLSNYIDNVDKYPEITGYVYGVEGNVLETVKNAVVNFFKKIFEILKKVFSWIKNLFSRKEKKDVKKKVEEIRKQSKTEILNGLNRVEKDIINRLRGLVIENKGLVEYLLYAKENNIDFVKEMKVTYKVANDIVKYLTNRSYSPKLITCEDINWYMDKLKEINYQAHILQYKTNHLRIFTFIKPKNNELYEVKEDIIELKSLSIDDINNDLLIDLYMFTAEVMDKLLKAQEDIKDLFDANIKIFDDAINTIIENSKDEENACINAVVTRLRPLIVAVTNLVYQMVDIKHIFKRITSLTESMRDIAREKRKVEEKYKDIKL